MTKTEVPFQPVGGRVLVKPFKWKPSKLLEVFSDDNAMISEGEVVALSPCRHGFNRKKGVTTKDTFPHEVQIGDRVVFQPHYQTEDHVELNGEKFYFIDSWKIAGIITRDRPDGYEHPVTGEHEPEEHPLLIRP